MAVPATLREAVMAWMATTGSGPTLASKKFGVSIYTIKYWRKHPPKPKPAPSVRVSADSRDYRKDGNGLEDVEGGKGGAHAATTRAVRAQDTKPPAPKIIQRTAANLTEPARELLRRAVFQQLEFLSDPLTVSLQKDRADASRALTSLLLGCPDILTFEDRTSGKDRTVGENAEAAQLAAVFDVQAGG